MPLFGASDEVLGAVESGVDFEKRIAAIYQQCRTAEQIQLEFDQLQRELADEIAAGAWHSFDHPSRELDRQKDGLLDEIGTRLEQRARLEPLFTVRWRLE